MNAVVELKDGQLDIWTGTQIPLFVVAMAAEVTGLRAEKIHLHSLFSGGSFGRRLEHDYVRQAVKLAKAHQGRPIKMTWAREEDMSHDFPRPLGMVRMRGAVKDGKVEAYDLKLGYCLVVWPAAHPDLRTGHRHRRGCLGSAVPDSALSRYRVSRAGNGAGQLMALCRRVRQRLSARLLP